MWAVFGWPKVLSWGNHGSASQEVTPLYGENGSEERTKAERNATIACLKVKQTHLKGKGGVLQGGSEKRGQKGRQEKKVFWSGSCK